MHKEFHHLSVKDTLSFLKTGEKGLGEEEAKKRLEKFGPNILPRKKGLTWLQIFFAQFKNPLVYILVIAGGISFFLRDFIDFSIILVVIIISSIIGFIQDYKANSAISKLRELVSYKARVIRGDFEKVIAAEDLVPGDIIVIEPGDKVPADSRIINSNGLTTIESSLTGESAPIVKSIEKTEKGAIISERSNIIFMGTTISRGSGKAVVVYTGKNTEFGKIAFMVNEEGENETPLQKQLFVFSKFIGVFVIVFSIIIFLIGILSGRELAEMFLISVAIMVAAVPEGLLPASTVILAVGMQKILEKKGLVRKMVAAETLGATSVICSDKTGTLTEGNMHVSEISTYNKKLEIINNTIEKPNSAGLKALEIGMLGGSAVIENPKDKLARWKVIGDPTDTAFVFAGRNAGVNLASLLKDIEKSSELPFNTEYKFMAIGYLDKDKNETFYIKGAPEKILEISKTIEIEGKKYPLSLQDKKKIISDFEKLTNLGLRVIAVSYKNVNKANNTIKKESLDPGDISGAVFVGLVALKDPLRPEAKEIISKCQLLGIRVIIITGDHRLTAKTIAKELGMKTELKNIMEGKELNNLKDEQLEKRLKNIHIFARVEARHKMRIIHMLQKKNQVVAMTGDGINDAPALKAADIGLAFGSGTDVAKESADLILLDNNFKTIVEAIKQGKIIFSNIRKVVLYLMIDGFTEIIMVLSSMILSVTIIPGLPIPFLPAQILWIKLAEDTTPAMALAFEAGDDDLINKPPRKIDEKIINKPVKVILFTFAFLESITLLALYIFFYLTSENIDYARTISFVGLGITSMFYVFSCRSLEKSIFKINPFSNKFILFSVFLGLILIIAAVYFPFLQKILHTVPLGINEWVILIFYGFFTIIILEIAKYLFIIKKQKSI